MMSGFGSFGDYGDFGGPGIPGGFGGRGRNDWYGNPRRRAHRCRSRNGGLLGTLLGAAVAGAAAALLSKKNNPQQIDPAHTTGVPIAAVICPSCGATASGNFCEFCGAPLRK